MAMRDSAPQMRWEKGYFFRWLYDIWSWLTTVSSSVSSAHSELDTHEGLTSGVHGVAGEVVGTDDVQTLENKSVPDLQMDITGNDRALTEGMLFWDTDAKTLAAKLEGPDVIMQIGQEQIVRVINKTELTITNGKAVFVSGSHGNRPKIELASAAASGGACCAIGLATHDIAKNNNGYVTVNGLVRDVNTLVWPAGTHLYLSATSPGDLTSTSPVFPNYSILVGRVILQGETDGIILVDPGIEPSNHVMLNNLGANVAAFGDHANGHKSSFEQDGTLVFSGNATVWDDSMVPPAYFRTGLASLSFDVLTGGLYAYRFDLNDEPQMMIQFPHGMKENTIIKPHIHIINKNAIGVENYNIAFDIEYTWASPGQVFPSTNTISGVTFSLSGASAMKHNKLSFADITPTAVQGGISSILIVRLKRVSAALNAYDTNDIFVAGFDVHVEKDTVGSRTSSDK